MNIHFKGVFFLTQKLLPVIADGGRIVNLSSGLARVALPGFAVYGALKGAIEVLTRYLAKELGERKIAVNVVAPGGIETDFGGGALRDIPEVNAFIASQTHQRAVCGCSLALGNPFQCRQPKVVSAMHETFICLAEMGRVPALADLVGHHEAHVSRGFRYQV